MVYDFVFGIQLGSYDRRDCFLPSTLIKLLAWKHLSLASYPSSYRIRRDVRSLYARSIARVMLDGSLKDASTLYAMRSRKQLDQRERVIDHAVT